MPTITFPSSPKYEFKPTVITFPADLDGKEITCHITLDEMMREFGRGNPDTFELAFREMRPQIEERARKQILAKLAEEQTVR